MTNKEIQQALAKHAKWIRWGRCKYSVQLRANLSGCDLSGADLFGVDLSEAILSDADLSAAVLSRSNLSEANLSGANLREACLSAADLSEANLYGADLSYALLCGARLCGADLSFANLSTANLGRASFEGATLTGTCLDPSAQPNGDVREFRVLAGYAYGFRSRKTSQIGQYFDGRHYSANVFSVSDEDCHPGLYLWPTRNAAFRWLLKNDRSGEEIIEVVAKATHIHKAGDKYRCVEFRVIGGVR